MIIINTKTENNRIQNGRKGIKTFTIMPLIITTKYHEEFNRITRNRSQTIF